MTAAIVRPATLAERFNTLQILQTTRIVLLALDVLLLGAVLLGAGVHRQAMQTVGNDTAPSIIAAQHIKAALAGMDADLANELLVPAGTATPLPGAYDQHRVDGAEQLIEAAKNITYGPSELVPIETMQVSTGTYERLAQEARDLEDDGQVEMSTRFYRAAAIVMDGTVLAAADDLDKANNDVLEREYESKSNYSLAARLFVGFAGLLALAALTAAQLFLSQRTHRTLNLSLLAASALTLGLTVYAFHGMGSEARHLKVASEDAFTSIRALWRARAMAYSAKGAESRWLLDPPHAGEYQSEFIARTNALARISGSVPVDRVLAAAAVGTVTAGFKGYLADELNNVTFQGEHQAAYRTLAAWEAYMTEDAEVRRLQEEAMLKKDEGKHQKAIELCIGISEGQAAWAFEQFDRALAATLKINKDAFDQAVADGLSAVDGMEWKAAVLAVLIAVLIAVGLAPRIREYM